MEPEDSLPHSQMPATCPHPESDRFSHLHVIFFTTDSETMYLLKVSCELEREY